MIIKYISNIEDLKENEYYSLIFDCSKCMQFIHVWGEEQKTKDEEESLLQYLDKKLVNIKYVGYSRVDGLELFVLDEKQMIRNLKIDDILLK